MDVGDAKIIISADDKASTKLKGVGTNLDSLGKKATKAGMVMMAAGVALMAGIYKMADSYTKAGDEVAKMAKRTGWGTEALSEMRYVAQLGGTSIESVEKAIKRMSSTVEDAKDGLETYTRSFDKLGLSVSDIVAMKPEEQFWAISNAIASLEDPTMRAALAQDFFGRAGTDLLPVLSEGTAAINEQRQAAHDLGVVFDEEAAANAEKFQDAITTLKTALAGLGAEIIDDLVPILEEYIEKAIEIIDKIKAWADIHPELAGHLFKLGTALAVGGAILVGLGMLAKAVTAINVAMALMHGLAGPAGWVKLAAGLAIAGGAIFGIKKLMESLGPEAVEMPEMAGIPEMQAGGIVPGRFGEPVPIMAHGGEMVSGLHGKAGTTVNISMGNYLGDESSLREFVRSVKDIFNQDVRRTSFPSVNALGYYPGSSAP